MRWTSKKIRDNIIRHNPSINLKSEVVGIGFCQIIDGLIAILSNGQYVGGFSSDAISKSIVNGIHRRREERNKRQEQ